MKPKQNSISLLGVTRSKAKMYEYSIPESYHITISKNPSELLSLSIGLLGDFASNSKKGEIDEITKTELQNILLFSAQYFDAYIESKLSKGIDSYLLLIGAASYYLCDLPGSSTVLASRIEDDCPDLDCEGLEDLLLWLLKGDFDSYFEGNDEPYGEYLDEISRSINEFYANGINSKAAIKKSINLQTLLYESGTPRQLLIGDIICAVLQKRIYNSSWKCLERYTDFEIQKWANIIKKPSFIKEFWPAQILLGKQNIFNGKSAVIQMPTSAGKTKASEIIIRSSFLSERSKMAILVAPFRALCSEIKNDLLKAFFDENVEIELPSDAFQMDFDLIEKLGLPNTNIILVLTPEKLLYMLRHQPDIAKQIGLIIYDEGHQFDSGMRGVTYELLLSTLKNIMLPSVQTILISAVISNAKSIGNWLNGDNSEIITGTNLSTTYRTVAFSSWKDRLGRLEFVEQTNPKNNQYFVPRVIEQVSIELKGRERKARFFPDRSDGKSIALYLGLKLVNNGSIAIFCGQKNSVLSMCEKIVDVYSRNYTKTNPPSNNSDHNEIERLTLLLQKNLGEEHPFTKASKFGIYGHSGNTPNGIRLAIENAMQKEKVKFVICTSTLAQGVNLPIKYLIVTSIYQGRDLIKTRDFHNLLGRAGRSGKHTEGTIIFADPDIYENKSNWRWKQIENILNPSNSEPCTSTLLSIFDSLLSDDKAIRIDLDPLDFLKSYLESSDEIMKLMVEFVKKHSEKNFTIEGLSSQLLRKKNIIASIESYLMAHWDIFEDEENEKSIVNLTSTTLAYYLANDEQKLQLIELFKLLSKNISNNLESVEKRKSYGKTLFGIQDIQEIENWVFENSENLFSSNNCEKLLESLWSLLSNLISNTTFKKIRPQAELLNLATDWMTGDSYFDIFKHYQQSGMKVLAKTQMRNLKQETIINICDNAFAFDASLIIAAVVEVVQLHFAESDEIIRLLNELQKRLKYGLANNLAIAFYEIGFCDRVIASELSNSFSNYSIYRNDLIYDIKMNKRELLNTLNKYPDYFTTVLKGI